MLEEAHNFAEQGVSKAGVDLLASAEHHAGAKTYVRIMTRLRHHELTYATLQKALDESLASLPVLKEQLQKQGIGGLTDAQWRENVRRRRMEAARTGMGNALQEMGSAVDAYFTPEERLAFADFAESRHKGMTLKDAEDFAIPLAMSAGLADQEARWRFESTMQRAGLPNHHVNIQPLVDLQRRRARFAELGPQMEQIAAVLPRDQRITPLDAAVDAYHSAGDVENELRVLSTVFSLNGLDTSRQERFFQLLLESQPQELTRIASMWPTSAGERAANYAVAHGGAELAHAVVQARGKARPPIWSKAYDALVGLYFTDRAPEVNHAFLAALGDDPIGVRLSKPVDRAQQLAGNTWFYYGARFGEYRGSRTLGNPEDFLPAVLEESPASASEYLTLADYYAGAGDTKSAIADYNHTLELSPDRPDVYDSLAMAYFKQGNRASALEQWTQALAVLSKQLNGARVSESFWRDFGRTCDQLRAHHLFSELRPEADLIVRAYLHHNGTWRSNAVLQPAYAAQQDPSSATAWLLEVSFSASDPAGVLADVADASWVPFAQRALIYDRILEVKQSAADKLNGVERQTAQQELGSWQERWVRYLVRAKRYSDAAAALAALPRETLESQGSALVPLELRVAAQLGTLDSKLSGYRTNPESQPAPEALRAAASQLLQAGDRQSARKILEFVFAREIEEHRLVAANFLGLAELRLAAGDKAGALDLLRRLVVVVGNPFENLDPAAALLEKFGHSAEAIEFLQALVNSSPWEPSFRLRLAQAKLAVAKESSPAQDVLSRMASDQNSPYKLRLRAAVALRGRTHPGLGSGELDLMATDHAAMSPTAADKFYFYEARIRAAEKMADPQMRAQILSHCVIDYPRRDAARIPLFQAATEVQSDDYALAVLERLFQTQFLRRYVSEPGSEDARIVSSEDEEAQHDEESYIPRTADEQLSHLQQARLAQLIGDTMIRVGRFADALSYYQTARTSEVNPSARKTLQRKIADVKNTVRIQDENAARQPLLHEALEQDRVVRPRLLARVTVTSGTASAKGGVKQ